MIQKQVKEEVIVAMKAKDKIKVDTLRGLSAAFTNELVAKGMKPTDDLADEDALAVIRREVKKRKEAKEAFEKGGRPDMAEKEGQEQLLLETYLPQMMPEDEIKAIVEAKKAELGVTEKKDAGRLMGMIMKELSGKADGNDVKKVVDSLF